MIPVLGAAEMRAADRRTIEEIGIPGAVLMENAGASVARCLSERFPDARRIAILCGKGNNGGDGFVVARRLLGRKARLVLLGRRSELKGDAALHAAAYERTGGRIVECASEAEWEQAAGAIAGSDLIVDALLGTGLDQAPAGLFAKAIDAVRAARAKGGARVIAVDIPSGLPSDAGAAGWPTVEADLTVTFAAPKWGHVLPPGCDLAGELLIADIGIPGFALRESGTKLGVLEAQDAALAFPPRPLSTHKGDMGHVLVIAGSLGKAGAAALCGYAALRAGAGLVTVATPAAALPAVAAARAELMTEPLPGGGSVGPSSLERALELAEARDAVVLGPGLGQAPFVEAFVTGLLARCSRPLVLDADGLNVLARALARDAAAGLPRKAPTVLTPHPGEMGRLLRASVGEVQQDRVGAVRRLAAATRAVALLKGQRSLVADPSGRTAVNPTGNPGLATAGSGDVLSGVVGALLARGAEAWLAATAAVYVHGRAGDLAAEQRGCEALVAGDVSEALGAAIASIRQTDGAAAAARL